MTPVKGSSITGSVKRKTGWDPHLSNHTSSQEHQKKTSRVFHHFVGKTHASRFGFNLFSSGKTNSFYV